MTGSTDYFLDITADVCPMTFVRTKLMVEKMPAGAVARVRLKGREPLENVPRSLAELGHAVQSLEREPGEDANGVHVLIIRKAG
ncbi:MAG: sulfurtransferase TusA family protein [Pseudomonadota bacterium]